MTQQLLNRFLSLVLNNVCIFDVLIRCIVLRG